MNRIFASAVGAFVAGILSLQFGGGIIATAASLISGGVVAWITYDIPGLLTGISRAFREAFRNIVRIDMRRACWAMAGAVCFATSISSFFFALSLIVEVSTNETFVPKVLVFSMYFGGAPILGLLSYYKYTRSELRVKAIEEWGLFFQIGNPISFTVVMTILVLRILAHLPGELLTTAPIALKKVNRFATLAFAYTHNEKRKLSFVSAVLGGAIGIYLKNPAIGAVAGGAIGWLYAPLTLGAAQRIVVQHRLRLAKATASK